MIFIWDDPVFLKWCQSSAEAFCMWLAMCFTHIEVYWVVQRIYYWSISESLWFLTWWSWLRIKKNKTSVIRKILFKKPLWFNIQCLLQSWCLAISQILSSIFLKIINGYLLLLSSTQIPYCYSMVSCLTICFGPEGDQIQYSNMLLWVGRF